MTVVNAQARSGMNKVLLGVICLASILAAAAVSADPMEDLAKAKQCFSCHQVDKDMIAPSFKTIARKYKGVNNADVVLADRIRKGGVAHFGNTPMPSESARVTLSEAEAKSLAAWVLATQ